MKFKIIVLLIFLSTLLYAKELQKVSLQLQWLDQFQFAGYYMAKEKGFYEDVGLDVEIKKFTIGVNPVEEVLSHKANYGTGRTSLIIDRSEGKKVELLSAIFQVSPLVLVTKKESGIDMIEDFRGKKVMLTGTETSASIFAMTASHNIYSEDMNIVKSQNKIKNLLDGNIDIISAYTSNQVYILKEKGIDITIFDPKDYGFDFYSDILFTSDHETTHNKNRTIDFTKASLKGWEYAFSHIQETVELILRKYNSQKKSKEALLYEANELKKLAYYKTDELGHIDANKIQRIYDVYNLMRFVKSKINLDEFIFHDDMHREINLTKEEKEYLKNKKELTVCVKKGWLPYESLEDGIFIGMSADFLNLYSKKLSIPLKITKIRDQVESLKYLQEGKCDIKPLMGTHTKTAIPYKSTLSYFSDSIALVTRIEQPFIQDLNILDNKKMVVLKGYNRFIEFIKKEYPDTILEEVADINTALELVASGKVFGYIGTSLTASYHIQKRFSFKLKIANDFETLEFGVGVLESETELLNILNKVIKSTTKIEKRKIFNTWVATTVDKETDYRLVWQLIIGFTLVLMIVLYFLIKQNRLKRSLERTQENFNLGQKIANIGIWSLDYETNKLEWTSGVHEIFETNVETFGVSFEVFMEFVHPDDRKKLNRAYSDSVQNKTDYFLEHRVVTSSGVVKYVEERCQNFFDKKGNILKSVGTVLDITEKKEAQFKLAHLNTTLERRVKEEVEHNRQKEKQLLQQSRMAQMGEMISMIAHQWRQPLGAIGATTANLKAKIMLGFFDVNKSEALREKNEYFDNELSNIEQYVGTLSSTIDDFRNFYKPNKESVVMLISEPLNKALSIIGKSLEIKNIECVLNLNCKKEIKLYDTEIMQVILNFLKNAEDVFIERATINPKIIIETYDSDEGVILSVCDNAGGIRDDVMEKVFDPYFSTKTDKNGTGLGLYMSKTIIEEHHNGKLHVNNSDEGACFTIELRSGGGVNHEL